MLYKVILAFLFLESAYGQWDPNFANGKYGIVHLFEWHWDTIANECETFLAPYQIGGVQISPPNENRIIDSRPWWERYQPISYILETRSGDRNAFADMVKRCNAVGVRIYPDLVINHMCGDGGSGTGTAGSYFDTSTESFPAVPYTSADFNDDKCTSSNGNIENYQDEDQVRNCRLLSLLDLDQGDEDVRGKILAYMNDLIDLGVAGFRVDASKHMWPSDLDEMFNRLNDLRSDVFGAGRRPYIYQEVIDQGGEPISASDYTYIGQVTEFKYGLNLATSVGNLENLWNFGESWGMLPADSALAFVNNHDNQRGHGGAGDVVTFQQPYELKVLTAFMLAWPYGVPRVMSSYYFTNSDEGPPSDQRSVNADGSCGNGWVCEHRWRPITNMFAFATAVLGTEVEYWWSGPNSQIAFSRENKGFIAMNTAGTDMSGSFQTGLPDGTYCDVIHGDFVDGQCSGSCLTVAGGFVDVVIKGNDANPMVALHVDAMTTNCNYGGNNEGTVCTDCDCTTKAVCGHVGTSESECTQQGCLWCPNPEDNSDPWCILQQHGGSPDCAVDDGAKQACGYDGIDQTECSNTACCWGESNTNGIPWCYYPA